MTGKQRSTGSCWRIALLAALIIMLAGFVGTSNVFADDGQQNQSTTAIYLNGTSGNDANDGASRENAVKTFSKARALASANQNITEIYVTGTVDVSGDVTLGGTKAKLIRDTGFGGDLLRVTSNAALANITIDGNKDKVKAKGSLIDLENGTLNLGNNAIVQNNNGGRAAVYVSSGTLNLGKGSKISGNTSSSWGGGVTVWGNGTINITGGNVEYNNGSAGGGIYIRGNSKAESDQAHLSMSGGSVNSNVSGAYGGGIYIGANSIGRITAGDINYNQERGNAWGGGGIYVNSDEKQPNLYSNGKLYIYNVEITGNTTTGGAANYDSVLSSCDTGKVDVNLTDGAVIHDNGAANTVLVYRQKGSSSYEISPIMLGGAPYNWVDKNGKAYDLGAISFTSDNLGWNYAKTNASAKDGTVSGLSRVRTHIIGNKSTYLGSAIGTNGDVYIGKSDGDVTLNLEKKWDESIAENTIPDSVQIHVYATDGNGQKTKIGDVTLSKDNEWKSTVKHLPKYDSDGKVYTYSYSEETDKYTPDIDISKQDNIDNDDTTDAYDVTITNTVKKDNPSSTTTTTTKKTTKTPKTGDGSMLLLYSGALILAAAGIAVLVIRKKFVRR